MSKLKSPQSSNTILMIRPADFAFNEETAADNEFQNPMTGRNVREEALQEFERATKQLTDAGIRVLVVEKDPDSPSMPDAVFPNNWFGTDSEGQVHVFPMKTPNRQAETSQLPQALSLLEKNGFAVKEVVDWRTKLGSGTVVEGTGSLILDRVNKVLYAALSERTQKEATLKLAAETGYEPVLFQTKSSKGFAYYHTNVVMSIGEKMAVACLECIPDEAEREQIKARLEKTHTLIPISIEQLEKGFCGNLLQVKDKEGNPVTVLSTTAYFSLSEPQKLKLQEFGKLLSIPIPTIETVGGGSIRCMMAEIFCPEKK